MVFRFDIQALRGLAVLLVVLYHAKLGAPAAGYLGVDIFFVISGYLITGIVKNGIEQGNFRFSEFYFRRAKRLLPAAYVVFFVTSLLATLILDSIELRAFSGQLFGAVTFTANIVLLRQSGYFDGEAALKPLLHVWSLSLEEQYYLLLPATLVCVPRRFWIAGASLVLAGSLVLCVVFMPLDPAAAFYLLPTRAWEFAVGSLAAIVTSARSKAVQPSLSFLFWPSLAALVAIPVFPVENVGIGIDNLIVCIATIVVILRRHSAFNANIGTRALAKVGDFSYSLYLVHWPIFAFLNNASIGESSSAAHLAAMALSLCLGFLLFRIVELPIRNFDTRISRKSIGAAAFSTLALAVSPFCFALARAPVDDFARIRRANVGFSAACEFAGNFTPKPACRNSPRPSLLVWGDSFAMHLVPGIVATTSAGVVQATRSDCGPLVGMAPVSADTDHGRAWAGRCLDFNQSVLDYLAATAAIEVVVMSSPFEKYLKSQAGTEPSISAAVEAMGKTVRMLRAMGKRVVVVAPPPASGFDLGRCLERKAAGLFNLGENRDCNIAVADYHLRRAAVLVFLRRIQDTLDVPVIYFDQVLCSGPTCVTSIDGTFIYRDSGHFSYDGSTMVAKKLGLGDLVQRVAK